MLINNTYTLGKIGKITGGECIGEVNHKINNIHYDSRIYVENNNHLFIAIKTKNNDGHKYIDEAYKNGIRFFLLDRPPSTIKKDAGYLIVNDTLKSLQKWAKHHRKKFNLPVLAISGSYGKTIVKEWIYFFLRKKYNIVRSPKSYNSQLGVSLSLLTINKSHDIAIIESGISNPGEMEILKDIISPTHTIITNIGSAHIENFKDIVHLKKEKEKLTKNTIHSTPKERNSQKISKKILQKGQEITVNYLNEVESFILNQKDEIYSENFLSCLWFLEQLNIDKKIIEENCSNLPEIAMRLEKKYGINNSTLINDSYNADLSSIKIAFETLKTESGNHKTTVILSDLLKDDFSENNSYNNIFKLIETYKIDQFIGIGSELYQLKKNKKSNFKYYKTVHDFVSKLNTLEIENHYVLIKGNRNKDFQKIALKLQAKKHDTVLEINLDSLKENLQLYKNIIPKTTKILVMIKAAGYGTGMVEIAKKLEKSNVDFLGVAYSDEGIELRKNKIKTPILVMNVENKSMEEVIENKLTPAIHNFQQLDDFTKVLIGLGIKGYPIHVKINTGMNRMGFDLNEIDELINYLLSQPELKAEGIFSHLAASDLKEGKEFTQQQIERFKLVTRKIEQKLNQTLIKHLLNTSGIESYNNNSFDMVRLGVGIYGISNTLPLANVATLYSRITKIRTVSSNEQIGYGLSNTTKSKVKIAIVPIGYADGFSRALGNGNGQVFINGSLVPTIGNICMDMAFFNVTEITAKKGDKVEIFGSNNSIISLAKSINTIPYEILSSISERVVRTYEKD